jgi:hypothetical protein
MFYACRLNGNWDGCWTYEDQGGVSADVWDVGNHARARSDARAAELVKLPFFVGLAEEQAAKELGLPLAPWNVNGLKRGCGCFGKSSGAEMPRRNLLKIW